MYIDASNAVPPRHAPRLYDRLETLDKDQHDQHGAEHGGQKVASGKLQRR